MVAPDGAARCEYCTEPARVEPLLPWTLRLLSLISGEPGGPRRRPAARGR